MEGNRSTGLDRVQELLILVDANRAEAGGIARRHRRLDTHPTGRHQRRGPKEGDGLAGDEDEDPQHGDNDANAAEPDDGNGGTIDTPQSSDTARRGRHAGADGQYGSVHKGFTCGARRSSEGAPGGSRFYLLAFAISSAACFAESGM